MGVEMVAIEPIEPRELLALATEELHDAHPRDVLLEICIDTRNSGPDLSISGAHRPLKDGRRHPDERNHGERRQGEPPIDRDHKHADATRVNRSPIPDTTPAVNSSFSDSTSEVTRVISRPTGLRSKNATGNRCRCAKSS